MWLSSITLPSAAQGEVGKSATSVGLRAPTERFVRSKAGASTPAEPEARGLIIAGQGTVGGR